MLSRRHHRAQRSSIFPATATWAEGSAKQMLLWIRLPDDHGICGCMVILGKRMGRSHCMDLAEGKPEFIQVATYLRKVIPRRQSLICRLVKGASAELGRVRPNQHASHYGTVIDLRSLCCHALESDLAPEIPQVTEAVLYNDVRSPNPRKGRILPKKICSALTFWFILISRDKEPLPWSKCPKSSSESFGQRYGPMILGYRNGQETISGGGVHRASHQAAKPGGRK
jgi:hypothetical protein